MSGTNYATDGLRRIIRRGPPVKIRLLGFLVVLVGGGALLAWIVRTTWDQLDGLQKEHAAVSSESFYLGVTLRGGIRGLNENLLQYGHAPAPDAREEFRREAADLKGLLVTNRLHLAELAKLPLLKQVLIDDFEILDRIQVQYERYLVQADGLLSVSNTGPNHLAFQERYARVRQASDPLISLCNDLVKAQREDFTDFLAETRSNLVSHQRLLKLILGLTILLAGVLALLAYRGLIAPLQLSLSQSRTIIERQEKLASLGVLASGVAHEVRNPLTAIKFRLFSLKKSLPALAEHEDATVIGNEILRLERIVKDFLRFARPSEPELATLAAAELVQEVRELLKGQLERLGIQLKLQVHQPAWVHADAQQLKQVLINLVQNAADAIGRQGLITLQVSTASAELEGRLKPVALLAITDTGQGIPPQVEARLFDPFFTTKDSGTGLGLAIAARIVEKHGGMLRYKTKLGQGTTFEVVLPRVEPDASEAPTH